MTVINEQPLIVLDSVVKRFGDFIAVKKMDFSIYKGEFLAIMGSSGCGKTTALRMLAGLEDPSEGEIRFSGRRINDLPSWQRDTPMVWQSLALFPFLTVGENVEFGLKMRRVAKDERRARVNTWLERMQISEFADRNVAHLSGGQRQRVALARALVTEPDILLLDEPLSALDAHLKIRMQSVLVNLQRELGITFVYVTHSQSEAFSMADRVVIMSRGNIEQIGHPQEIYRSPRSRFVAEFLGSANIFGGEIIAFDAHTVSIRTATGCFTCRQNMEKNPKLGDKVSFVVSDDCMRITDAAPANDENTMQAVVIGEEFVGATAIIHMEAVDNSLLKAQKSHEALAKLQLGNGRKVWLSWSRDAAHILPGQP